MTTVASPVIAKDLAQKERKERKGLKRIDKLTVFIIYWICILLFGYTAWDKLTGMETFRFQLGKSPLVTEFAGFASWAVPIGEVATCVLLYIEHTRILGFYLFFFGMVLFTAYLYTLLNYSFYIPCSCASIFEGMAHGWHMILNLAFAGLAAWALLILSGNS